MKTEKEVKEIYNVSYAALHALRGMRKDRPGILQEGADWKRKIDGPNLIIVYTEQGLKKLEKRFGNMRAKK